MKTIAKRVCTKPYTQGELDGLCGLYAAINAIRLHSKVNYRASQDIFLGSLKLLSNDYDIPSIVFDGITRACLSKILNFVAKETAKKGKPVHLSWPFYKRKSTNLDVLWKAIDSFMHATEGNSVILSISGNDWGHWTVVKEITPQTIILFDSWHRKLLKRNRCTVGRLNKNRNIRIDITSTCFISKDHGQKHE